MENDTSALKLTTASYWRPSGKNIHRFPDSKETDDWGVSPDPGFEVKMNDEDRLKYMIYRNNRDLPPEAQTKEDDKEPFKDRVLEKAVEHLKKEMNKGDAAAELLHLKNA